ncbi:hypothetical protein, partial [Latilactobacillus curvatus]|uniref:hypothetical protein n=1 Tax=Latilactobacillus curvatus TaxID=28038 RepID=UPI00223C0DF0
ALSINWICRIGDAITYLVNLVKRRSMFQQARFNQSSLGRGYVPFYRGPSFGLLDLNKSN